MDEKLTKDAKQAIAVIYKTYLERRKRGIAKSAAGFFDTNSEDFTAISPIVSENLKELKDAGFIKAYIYGDFELKPEGIIFMENLGKDTILKWLGTIADSVAAATSIASLFIP